MQQLGAALKRVGGKLGIIVCAWTLLALMLAIQEYALIAARGTPASFFRLLKWAALDYWIWAALTPFVFRMASKFQFHHQHITRILAVHCFASIAFCLLHITAAMLVGVPCGTAPAGLSASALKARLLLDFYSDLWMYWPLVGLWNLLEYQKRYRERTVDALKLESQLANAQLQALRSQMQPHFLFNTLNSISALMQEDVNAAEDMISDLSYMLRVSLRGGEQQEVRLASELDLLEAYVRIQRKRFEDRLEVCMEIPVETLDALVPSLVLQPLVENAIRHGLAPLARPGKICIRSCKEDGKLILTVADNGAGLPANYHEGIGLSNTRQRLVQLYRGAGNLDLRGTPEQGVIATVALPFRYADSCIEEQEHEDYNTHNRRRTTVAPASSVAALD